MEQVHNNGQCLFLFCFVLVLFCLSAITKNPLSFTLLNRAWRKTVVKADQQSTFPVLTLLMIQIRWRGILRYCNWLFDRATGIDYFRQTNRWQPLKKLHVSLLVSFEPESFFVFNALLHMSRLKRFHEHKMRKLYMYGRGEAHSLAAAFRIGHIMSGSRSRMLPIQSCANQVQDYVGYICFFLLNDSKGSGYITGWNSELTMRKQFVLYWAFQIW